VLGHLQRGGTPTTLDRIQNYQVRHVPIAEAVNRLKLVPPHGEMVQTARDVDISFGD
jgi:hypothetical protein